jgi:anti-sigma regulatory factor (Ser/Thr protein kinase)
MVSSASFPSDVTAPKSARAWVAGELTPLALDPAKHAAVVLLVSELVTNVVTHTDSAPVVTLRVEADLIVLNVEDSSTAPPVQQAPGADLRGLGLTVVDKLAESWGVRSKEDGGKIVWAAIARR